MRRLVDLTDLETKQYEELIGLLRGSRIAMHETISNSMGNGAIWVRDSDFPRAVTILRKESASFAANARETWERQWEIENKNSFMRWFAHKLFRSPVGTLFQVVLLALLIGVFVIFPTLYVLRRAL